MKKDLRNLTFGKLKVLDFHSKTRNGHIRYVCQCECGCNCNILSTHLLQGNSISCGKCTKIKGKNHLQWNGFEEISGNFWRNILRSSNGSKGRRKIELSITKEYIWDLYIKQNKKCKFSNIELTFLIDGKDRSFTASLDRIDSSLGYIEGNVQWVHKDINIMKNRFTDDYFIKMCKLISESNYKI